MYERSFKLSFTSRELVITFCDSTVTCNPTDSKIEWVCLFSFSTLKPKELGNTVIPSSLYKSAFFKLKVCLNPSKKRKVLRARVVPCPYKIPALHQKKSCCCLLYSCTTCYPVHRILFYRHFLLSLSFQQLR